MRPILFGAPRLIYLCCFLRLVALRPVWRPAVGVSAASVRGYLRIGLGDRKRFFWLIAHFFFVPWFDQQNIGFGAIITAIGCPGAEYPYPLIRTSADSSGESALNRSTRACRIRDSVGILRLQPAS